MCKVIFLLFLKRKVADEAETDPMRSGGRCLSGRHGGNRV